MADEIQVGKFSIGELTGWKDEISKGKTDYSLIKEEGKTVLKAHSVNAASGLIKKVKLDMKAYPILAWSWKVDHTLKKEDATRKSGDDFAARIYVVLPRTFFWQTRAINYVWAAKLPKGNSVPSPYTAKAMIIAVESGDEKAGQWVSEERNYYNDYRKLFDEEPPKLGAVAIMTDTDDTRDEATAYFGDIFFESPKYKGRVSSLSLKAKYLSRDQLSQLYPLFFQFRLAILDSPQHLFLGIIGQVLSLVQDVRRLYSDSFYHVGKGVGKIVHYVFRLIPRFFGQTDNVLAGPFS
jgi:hypothetical protein